MLICARGRGAGGEAAAGFEAAGATILEAGTQIEQQQKQEVLWRGRETELLKALNDAQVRWIDFSDRLDALERSLPSGVSR